MRSPYMEPLAPTSVLLVIVGVLLLFWIFIRATCRPLVSETLSSDPGLSAVRDDQTGC